VSLGGLNITSGSVGLKLKAVAGGPSVTRLTQRSWIEENPSGIPKTEERKMETTSPMLDEII